MASFPRTCVGPRNQQITSLTGFNKFPWFSLCYGIFSFPNLYLIWFPSLLLLPLSVRPPKLYYQRDTPAHCTCTGQPTACSWCHSSSHQGFLGGCPVQPIALLTLIYGWKTNRAPPCGRETAERSPKLLTEANQLVLSIFPQAMSCPSVPRCSSGTSLPLS